MPRVGTILLYVAAVVLSLLPLVPILLLFALAFSEQPV